MSDTRRGRILSARGAGDVAVEASARGVALFFGLFSLANTVAQLRSPHTSADLWWLDVRFLPTWLAAGVVSVSAVLLLAFAVLPRMGRVRRILTLAACAALAAVALRNTADFYRAWHAGAFVPGVWVPLSLVIAVAFGWLGWAVWSLKPRSGSRLRSALATGLVTVLLVAAFPLAQIAFFGTSDYRTSADAAVVFGAKAQTNGALSTSLRDRVTTGVALYKAGLVRKLVMSGAIEPSGADEPVAMRDAAVRAGVSPGDVLLDEHGVNTDATVQNTMRMFEDAGIRRVLVVSQGYHLPRVKLAYTAAGMDVRTVPAGTSTPIVQTPIYILREVPAFWQYWARAWTRDVTRGS